MTRVLIVVRAWWVVAAMVFGGTLCVMMAPPMRVGTARDVVFGAGVVMLFVGLRRFYRDDALWGAGKEDKS